MAWQEIVQMRPEFLYSRSQATSNIKAMTDRLALALLKRDTPFNKVTMSYSFDSEERLLAAYRVIQSALARQNEQKPLTENADWHFHDGYRNGGIPLEWEDWIPWTYDAKILREKWNAEDFVHRSVYPVDHQWLLRYMFWYVPETPAPVLLDFTGPIAVNREVYLELNKIGFKPIEVADAYEWFNANGYTLENGKLRY